MSQNKISIWSKLFQPFACIVGQHRWRAIKGTRKETGFAIPQFVYMCHELQQDELCTCCRKHRTVYGLYNPHSSLDKFLYEGVKRYDDKLWPLDANGNRKPSYVDHPDYPKVKTYFWHPKTKYHGKAGPELEWYDYWF